MVDIHTSADKNDYFTCFGISEGVETKIELKSPFNQKLFDSDTSNN